MAENKRGNWTTWFEFLFSCLGCMVGLGNIWRFPYLCYKNGGGAFLIPYFLFMGICALPLVCLEVSVAQFANLGPGKSWVVCPLLKGVGFGMVALTLVLAVYYNVIIGWAIYYIANSFQAELPWSTCGHYWNTPNCYIRGSNVSVAENVTGIVLTSFNNTGNDTSLFDGSGSNSYITSLVNTTNITRKTPAEEFWDYHVLQRSDGIGEIGGLRWELFLCLLAAWVATFLCIIKGIKTSGKVMYVAATLPYLMLLVLLLRGLFLPGSIEGLKYYMIPKWEKLLDPSVWSEAAVQVFFSAGIGYGGIATLASFNNFHNDCVRDGLVIPILDALTSWFAGMIIFVTLGFMAHQSDLDVSEVVAEGPGIAFMVYPEAVAQLPLPQLWSVCFFLLLFTVGLDTQIVLLQTITTAITDNFTVLRGRTVLTNCMVCIPLFGLGIICTTQGGIYVLHLIDWYGASVAIMPLVILELVGLSYIYGVDRLYEDFEMMTGRRPCFMWKVAWLGVGPLFTTILWIASLLQMTQVKYAGQAYPAWAEGIGWMVAMIPLIPIPIGMIMALRQVKGPLLHRIRLSLKPTAEWGPADDDLKEEYHKKHPTYNYYAPEMNGYSHAMKPML